MTQLEERVRYARVAPVKDPAPAGARASARRKLPRGSTSPSLRTLTLALSLLAAVLLGFAADLALVSGIQHSRNQTAELADFRSQLALATAPVSQLAPAKIDEPTAAPSLLALGTPIAVLDIPRLGMHQEVVGEGTTAGALEHGPGHLRYTVMPGQQGASVIMGRRATYGGPFRQLASLRPGDRITVTTGQGASTYSVIVVRRAGDPIPAWQEGEGRLTLATADGPWFLPSGVLRVDARLTSKPFAAGPRYLRQADMGTAELPLGTDPSSWVAIVLLGQLLLIGVAFVVWVNVRWGRWHAWVMGLPMLAVLCMTLADQVVRLLPNLL